ncbi:hypothetical protein OCV62_06610 [Gallintestinimicrobium propionicum]|uniref:hypothetical protein n=1 Tax=Gallintestinimicrobium propionicum TaxID=2981770 RepID=UPI0008214C5C|nr:hypothetical protein [Gallintestinimicrobium propionicum]MCU6689656.1 hypothetical protein [Gallintestinimicrobium propionicum]SCI69468.1 Uncharacterised protein [uncultured Clostridium sp.]
MKKKKLTASMIALVMSVSLPMTTYAANWYLEDGSVTVNADNSEQTVTQGSGSAVPDEAPVITQRKSSVETGNTITINAAENATANVTISDVNINTSDAAVSTNGKGNVNIELDGTNTLQSGRNYAGLEKSNDGKMTITDENENGKLIATGGNYGAGIGGGDSDNGSNITITGGDITATGGDCGAGIGGGFSAGGKNITIAGGKVTAIGGTNGAGIGGGFFGDGNDITIAGGKVTATGGDYGAGIGGGDHGEGKNITITDGEVTAAGGTNGAGIGGGLRKNGEKITVSGDATLKVQGGPADEGDGAGAGIGNGGSHNGDYPEPCIPVNGAETEPDTSNLTTGKIEYYAPGADMTKDEPTSTTLGSGQPEPTSPGETAAPVEYRMQTSASEPVQGNGKSTGYKAPVQGHFYQVVGQDGKAMIFATAQKKDVLAIATDSDFAMLTGKMEDIEALRKQGVRRIIFATKRATSTFLLSELLEKKAYGETWSLIHDGENVAFTAVEKMMDISSILTRLQTK